jgi:hypothetical protein
VPRLTPNPRKGKRPSWNQICHRQQLKSAFQQASIICFSGRLNVEVKMVTATTPYTDKTVLEVEMTGSVMEGAIGIAVVVLAIIGLAHVGSGYFGGIAAIALGAALLVQGAAIGVEYSKLLSVLTGGSLGAAELGGGVTAEMLAGGGIIVLGILALLGFSSDVLLSAGVIAVGAALILSAGGLQRLNALKVQAVGVSEIAQKVTEGAVACAIRRTNFVRRRRDCSWYLGANRSRKFGRAHARWPARPRRNGCAQRHCPNGAATSALQP